MNRFEDMMGDSKKRSTTKRGLRDDEPSTKSRDHVETDESSTDDEEKENYITTPDGQKVTWDCLWSNPFYPSFITLGCFEYTRIFGGNTV